MRTLPPLLGVLLLTSLSSLRCSSGAGNGAAAPTADLSPVGLSDTPAAAPDGAPARADTRSTPPPRTIPLLEGAVPLAPGQGVNGIQIQPAAAVDAAGALAVVWSGTVVDGGPLGIWLATRAPGEDFGIVTAMDPDGPGQANEPALCARGGVGPSGWVAAWSVDTQSAGSNLQIRVRHIAADGSPEGEPHIVETGIDGNHWLADVACRADGGYVVVGVRPDPDGTFGVFALPFEAGGDPAAEAITVNPAPAGTQSQPVVAMAGQTGAFVVAWDDSTDGLDRVMARAFPAPPAPPGGPLHVAGVSAAGAAGATVAADPLSGAWAVGAVLDSDLVVELAAGPDGALEALTLPPGPSPRRGAALAFLGRGDALAMLWFEGSGVETSIRIALLGAGAPETSPATLATQKLPPYFPTVAYSAGRLAAVWTERTADDGFVLAGALFGE